MCLVLYVATLIFNPYNLPRREFRFRTFSIRGLSFAAFKYYNYVYLISNAPTLKLTTAYCCKQWTEFHSVLQSLLRATVSEYARVCACVYCVCLSDTASSEINRLSSNALLRCCLIYSRQMRQLRCLPYCQTTKRLNMSDSKISVLIAFDILCPQLTIYNGLPSDVGVLIYPSKIRKVKKSLNDVGAERHRSRSFRALEVS